MIENKDSLGYSSGMATLIIFDLDGTLADTRADLAYAVNLTRTHYGLELLSRDEIAAFVGNGAKKLIERSFTDKPELDIDEAIRLFMQFYSDNLIGETALYQGVIDGLEDLLRKGHMMAVLSNKPGDLCRQIITHFNLDKYFITVMGGGDAAELKPEPAGINYIINQAETAGFCRKESDVWMVGDHYTDLKSAENAGIGSVFCAYGFGDRRGLESDFEISDFKMLSGIL